MPKFRKEDKKYSESKKIREFSEHFAFKSVITSTILAGAFLISSLLFNAGIITVFMNRNQFWDIIDIVIKVCSILLGFFFMMISVGNYKNLTGKLCDWKMIMFLFGLSLAQAIRNLMVFLFTLFGLVMILIYFFLIQES